MIGVWELSGGRVDMQLVNDRLKTTKQAIYRLSWFLDEIFLFALVSLHKPSLNRRRTLMACTKQ